MVIARIINKSSTYIHVIYLPKGEFKWVNDAFLKSA